MSCTAYSDELLKEVVSKEASQNDDLFQRGLGFDVDGYLFRGSNDTLTVNFWLKTAIQIR